MHIAVFISSNTLSGAEKRAAKIARALIGRGWRVTLFMSPKTHAALVGDEYRFDWPPIVVWRHPRWIRWLGGRSARRLGLEALARRVRRGWWRRILRRHDVDVAHVYLSWSICRDLPIPHLFEITSPDIARSMIAAPSSLPASTVLHPNSEVVDDALGGSFPANRRIVAPHAFFDPAEPPDFAPPQKHDVIVFGHRLVERKNPVVFARAAKRFLHARDGWRVMIRGDGPLEGQVRAVLADEISRGRAEIRFNANLMDDLWRSRVFVSIETEDNYSNQSVLEAMWCCNALVLSDRGRSRARYFRDNGVLCEPDEDSVLAAMLAATGDPVALGSCAAKSRRLVETEFSREGYLDHLEAIYRAMRLSHMP